MQKLILALLFATFCATILSLPDEVAHCKMIGTSGDVNITGTIVFRAIDVNNTEVTVDISGITKRTNSSHGMHIHAAGDMVSSADGGSADGHFIGGGQAVHGCPGLNASRHSGDMGAWNVSVSGKIQQTKVLDKLPLTGPNSIIGHAAVLHFDNDYCIGATGNAGSRLAWCVVGVANITGAGKTNTAGVDTTASTVYNATCKLQPTINGVNVSGSFWFKQTGADLDIWGKVSGLVFNSTHGVHIHAFGDLFSNDGLRTAGHYNPTAGTHKLPPSTGRHVGDLGNIQYYDSNGVAWYHETLPGVNIVGENSIIGRGLIVHAMADNGCTQPTGASAARLAQCVIGFGGSKFTAPPTIPNEVTIVPQIGSLCSPSGTPATADQVECFAKVLNCKIPFDNCKLGETFTKGITCTKCWPDLIKCLNNEAVNLCYDNNQKTTCLADCPTSIATCDGADGIKITASFLLIALLLLVSLMF